MGLLETYNELEKLLVEEERADVVYDAILEEVSYLLDNFPKEPVWDFNAVPEDYNVRLRNLFYKIKLVSSHDEFFEPFFSYLKDKLSIESSSFDKNNVRLYLFDLVPPFVYGEQIFGDKVQSPYSSLRHSLEALKFVLMKFSHPVNSNLERNNSLYS